FPRAATIHARRQSREKHGRPFRRRRSAAWPRAICVLSQRFGMLADIQEHASGQQHNQQARTAVTNKGQRDSLCRHQPEHHAQIHERLADYERGDSEGQQAAKRIRGTKCRAESTPRINSKQNYNRDSSDVAKLFAQNGVDKIRVRFGKIKKLLLAFHQADARQAAGANRDQRLHQLKAAALRVRTWRKKSEHALVTIMRVNNEQINGRQCSQGRASNVFHGHARLVQHHEGNQENHARRAHVRLAKNQRENNNHRTERGQQSMVPSVYAETAGTQAQFQKPRQIENHNKLREFRGLQTERAEMDPPMRRMRAIQKQNADEHQQNHSDARVNDARLAELAIIDIHQTNHSEQAHSEPDNLALEKHVAIAVQLLGGYGRG